MARTQVREVSGPERIQGIASPVSTYVRPADQERSTLHELAQGLEAFDAGLGSFMAQRREETALADKAKAVTDFHRNNQKSYADAVREGLIPATASKSYVEWYKRQQGQLAGLKLADKFSLDYQQWDGRDSDDPAAFSQFLSGWMTENVGDEQDPYILEGLAPHLDNLAASGYDTFNQERAASLKAKAKATSGAILTDTVMRSHEEGRAEGAVDYDTLWSNLMAQREEAISKGERGEDFDKLIVDSVILQAEESGSVEMLNILDKVVTGSELPLSKNQEVREKRLQAIDRITNRQASQATDLAKTRERLEKQQHEDKLAEAVLAISNGEDVPEETIRFLSRRDGEIRLKLTKYKKEYGDQDIEEDPQALMHVYEQIDAGAGKKFILEMREKGVIRNPATFLKAMDRVQAVQKAAGDGGVFNSPTYKDTVKLITNATGVGEFSALDGVRGLSSEGMEALYDYRNMLLEWDMKNPDSTLLDKEKAAREMGEIIRSRIQADPSGDLAGTYTSEADKAKQEAPPPPEPSVQGSADPTEEHDGGYIQNILDWFTGDDEQQPTDGQGDASQVEPSQDAAPPLESLSQPRRAAVESLATKRGISVEEANQLLHERMQKLSSGSDWNPMNIIRSSTKDFRDNLQEFESGLGSPTDGVAAISVDTKDKLTALLKDPPKVQRLTASNVPVAPLLSLIGNTEGTDKGDGYNETLGYGKYTGGDVELVGMTLGEIDQLQTKMLRHPDNRLNSSAIGRYQIIRTTLRGIKQEMGLTDDMKFTPELQDQMAMHLLERRGLSKWQAGKMTDEQFMAGLSAEWASLPKANGKGTYRGQRVGTSAHGVKGVLNTVRGTEVASLDPSVGMPPNDPYANIPDVDSNGQAGQRERFRQWNPDPIGRHEENLKSIDPSLANVVRRAQEISGVKFVVGSGKRDQELQDKAVKWGWSKTDESDHEHGGAVDLWPVDDGGSIKFDPAMQQEIVMAMKLAAKELGIDLDIGAEWKSFKDKPHFGIKHKG